MRRGGRGMYNVEGGWGGGNRGIGRNGEGDNGKGEMGRGDLERKCGERVWFSRGITKGERFGRE